MIPAKTPAVIPQLFGKYIWDKPNAKNLIYLTFDDGPIPEVTPWVLEVLTAYKIPATFFCVGENISKHPDIFKRLIYKGHGIGNHTYNHLNAWETSKEDYLDNIKKAQKIISDFGIETSLFRPPYGKLRIAQSKTIMALNYEIIMWSVLSKDYNTKLDSEKVYNNIISNTNSGSIIVCHDNIKAFDNLKTILPRAIETLLEKGFEFGKL